MVFAQEIDADDIFNKLERLEKNVSDLQKGKFDSLDKSLSTGYISRNEKRIDQIDTNLRQNFGTLEEIQNQINIISDKLDIINQDFQSRISKIEKKIELYEKNKTNKTNKIKSESLTNSLDKTFNTKNIAEKIIAPSNQGKLSEEQVKKNMKMQ